MWSRTVGRTFLDEWSASRRGLYPQQPTKLARDRHSCLRRDSNAHPQQTSSHRASLKTARPLVWACCFLRGGMRAQSQHALANFSFHMFIMSEGFSLEALLHRFREVDTFRCKVEWWMNKELPVVVGDVGSTLKRICRSLSSLLDRGTAGSDCHSLLPNSVA